jgi:hypothetical protein
MGLFQKPDFVPPLPSLPAEPRAEAALPVSTGQSQLRDEQPTHALPVGEIETTLAGIWADVLGIERVGRHDNFSELGGQSLLATRVIACIRAQLDVEISLRAFFEQPTIEALAVALLQKQIEADPSRDMERMLSELEAMTEDSATQQLSNEQSCSGSTCNDIPPAKSVYHCPDRKSPWFGRRRCNLLIVLNEGFDIESFGRVARWVGEFDPLINTVVVKDQAGANPNLPPLPTLTFAPALLRHQLVARGKAFSGFPLSKSQEYRALESAGISVPLWVLLEEGATPDLSGFDDYVVQKPDYGGKGAEVKVIRKGRVRWKPIATEAAGMSASMIIQELISTGPKPVSYRVNTFFGKVLYSVSYENPSESMKPGSSGRTKARLEWGSIVASTRGSKISLNFDTEIIGLGEAAAKAFPDMPLLGFDIIREVPSGKLYVLEANAIGYVWNFSSASIAEYGCFLEGQFDGVRKAAYILAEQTQQHAS